MSKKKDHANGTNGTHAAAPDTQPAPAPEGVLSGATKCGPPYTQSLPVPLDEEALAAIRGDLTKATMARVAKEAEVAYLRDEIKGLKDTEAKLVGKLEKGTEEKPVLCQDYLLKDNRVMETRTDTDEVLGERTADADDLQEELPGTEDDGGEGGAEISEDRP